jgi:hypothetical protein
VPQHPRDEHDHAGGLERDLPARLVPVEVGITEGHDERRVEEQPRRDRRGLLGILAHAAEHEIQEHQDGEQPVDLGHGARDPAQLLLLERAADGVARRRGGGLAAQDLARLDVGCHFSPYYPGVRRRVPWNIPPKG